MKSSANVTITLVLMVVFYSQRSFGFDKCLQPSYQRRKCGKELTEIGCQLKGCCFDSSAGKHSKRCYHGLEVTTMTQPEPTSSSIKESTERRFISTITPASKSSSNQKSTERGVTTIQTPSTFPTTQDSRESGDTPMIQPTSISLSKQESTEQRDMITPKPKPNFSTTEESTEPDQEVITTIQTNSSTAQDSTQHGDITTTQPASNSSTHESTEHRALSTTKPASNSLSTQVSTELGVITKIEALTSSSTSKSTERTVVTTTKQVSTSSVIRPASTSSSTVDRNICWFACSCTFANVSSEKMIQLRKMILRIKYNETAVYRMSKMSVYENKPVPVTIGLAAVIVLCGFICTIISFDCIKTN